MRLSASGPPAANASRGSPRSRDVTLRGSFVPFARFVPAVSLSLRALPVRSTIETPVEALLHEPAVAHHDRLARERGRRESGQEQNRLGHVFHRCKNAVDRAAQHQFLTTSSSLIPSSLA